MVRAPSISPKKKKRNELVLLNEDDFEKLREKGIKDLAKLYEQTLTPLAREKLCKETGISEEKMLEYAHKAEMFQVKEMTAHAVDILWTHNITSLKELKDIAKMSDWIQDTLSTDEIKSTPTFHGKRLTKMASSLRMKQPKVVEE